MLLQGKSACSAPTMAGGRDRVYRRRSSLSVSLELARDAGRQLRRSFYAYLAGTGVAQGAGLDVDPWSGSRGNSVGVARYYDHRPAYIETRSLPACVTLCSPLDQLQPGSVGRRRSGHGRDHHRHDRTYLRQLAASSVGYIGLLGPGRRDRLSELRAMPGTRCKAACVDRPESTWVVVDRGRLRCPLSPRCSSS